MNEKLDEFQVDMRTVSFDIPPQEILTKDSVTISVDAVVYYKITNANGRYQQILLSFDKIIKKSADVWTVYCDSTRRVAHDVSWSKQNEMSRFSPQGINLTSHFILYLKTTAFDWL